MKVIAVLVAGMLAALAVLWFVASHRWDADTRGLVAHMTSAPRRPGPARFHASELEGLPVPVARYLRKVLADGQPMIRRARFVQRGTFLVTPPKGWRPFDAIHTATAAPAGFVWDARIGMAAGIDVRVRDSFVDGSGRMHASLASLVPLADVQGTPEIAAAALMRWLAEAAWYPTALLPSQGVQWSALDDSTARATLREGRVGVSLDFHFGADSLVTRVYSAARGRDVNGHSVPTPWQGRMRRYERCAGLLIPLAAEVEWLLPAGAQPYWRGELTEVQFEYE
jgi:hypothetical protein